MVMATTTADREPEKGSPDRLELLVDDVEAKLGLLLLLVVGGAESEEAAGDEIPLDRGRVGRTIGGKEVTGKLRHDEPVIGEVGVDGGDHPVAVAPGILEQERPAAAARFGEAGEIEPMTAETFAEGRVGEEVVDEVRHRPVGVAGMRGDEGIGLLRRRR